MARLIKPRTSLEVEDLTCKPGLHAVGDNLYLNVTETVWETVTETVTTFTRSWIFRFMLDRRSRAMGLGSHKFVSLAKAREMARKCGEQVEHGIDPIEARRAERAERKQRAASREPFETKAERFIKRHEPAWKKPQHARTWRNSLKLHAYPKIGSMWWQDIRTSHILEVVEPIWFVKPAAAAVVLNRLEQIFDDLIAQSDGEGRNPARWVHHLENSLPPPSQVRSVRSFPSLPYERLPEFIRALHETDHLGARPLEFLILTLMRTETVLLALLAEIPEGALDWSILPERLKGLREEDNGFRVPLCTRAREIVEEQRRVRNGPLIFPGTKKGKTLANSIMRLTLDKMEWDNITPHGFRSTFRTWAEECTDYKTELVEVCMAHTELAAQAAGVSANVWRAYQRGELLEKRRALMNDWEKFALGR